MTSVSASSRPSFFPSQSSYAHAAYPGAPPNASSNSSLASLQSCVASMAQSCETLEASVATLREATSDLPRLAKVVACQRHFDLVSESQLQHARRHLQAEMAPHLRQLILAAEHAVANDEARLKLARQKLSQLQARHAQLESLHSAQAGRDAATSRSAELVASQLASRQQQLDEALARREALRQRSERLERQVAEQEAAARAL